MKSDIFLSTLGLASVLGSIAGLALDFAVLPLFALTAAVMIVAISATDYRRRRRYDAPLMASTRRRETMPLAA